MFTRVRKDGSRVARAVELTTEELRQAIWSRYHKLSRDVRLDYIQRLGRTLALVRKQLWKDHKLNLRTYRDRDTQSLVYRCAHPSQTRNNVLAEHEQDTFIAHTHRVHARGREAVLAAGGNTRSKTLYQRMHTMAGTALAKAPKQQRSA